MSACQTSFTVIATRGCCPLLGPPPWWIPFTLRARGGAIPCNLILRMLLGWTAKWVLGYHLSNCPLNNKISHPLSLLHSVLSKQRKSHFSSVPTLMASTDTSQHPFYPTGTPSVPSRTNVESYICRCFCSGMVVLGPLHSKYHDFYFKNRMFTMYSLVVPLLLGHSILLLLRCPCFGAPVHNCVFPFRYCVSFATAFLSPSLPIQFPCPFAGQQYEMQPPRNRPLINMSRRV